MKEVYRALLPWDGTNKVFFDIANFAVLAENDIELATPELGVFPAPEDVLTSALQGVDVFFAGSEYVTRAVFENVPSLKLVQRIGVGYEKVDVKAASELGVLVARTRDTLSQTVAEHTYALMLALAGRIPWYDRQVKSGHWSPELWVELDGASLGIIGLGAIGREVAKRAPALNMKVLAYDPVQDPVFAQEHQITYLGLAELLSAADVITLSLPMNDRTRGLIDWEALTLMKPTAYVINIARGPIVDEVAMCKALAEGRIAGYATDVFTHTPPSADDPLLQFDNVIVTPWVAAASRAATCRTVRAAADCAVRILSGRSIPEGWIVNPEVLPKWRGRAPMNGGGSA